MYANPIISVSLALVSLVSNGFISQYNTIDSNYEETNLSPVDGLVTLNGNALVQSTNPSTPIVTESRVVLVTAYSSTPDQTDSTPFITASGSHVRDGIVACNFLSFGTYVRFPDMYGDKVFVVEDRMALRNSHKIDIWFNTRWEAIQFGARNIRVEVLAT
ncbi:MAG: hypothetical protein V1901_01630 [Patescibacteria group bacterium]